MNYSSDNNQNHHFYDFLNVMMFQNTFIETGLSATSGGFTLPETAAWTSAIQIQFLVWL
jgi:hypothetical protein